MDDLIQKARSGNMEAFNGLVAKTTNRLYAVAIRILNNQHDAEDAVQTALVEAWQDLPKLRDVQKFDGWLYVSLFARATSRREARVISKSACAKYG